MMLRCLTRVIAAVFMLTVPIAAQADTLPPPTGNVILELSGKITNTTDGKVAKFDLVAGVPLGGLHIATAYSLVAQQPMVYLHPNREELVVEGVYSYGQTAIIMDDLVTGGGSIAETAGRLREAGLMVRDAFVLVDRQQGARERLKAEGINLRAVLSLEVILNYLMSSGLIEEEQYRRSMAYLESGSA